MKFATVRNLRLETRKILAEARERGVLVTYRGKPWVLMQGVTEDELEDYILVNHPKFKKALKKSRKEKKAGKMKSLYDLAQELGIEL